MNKSSYKSLHSISFNLSMQIFFLVSLAIFIYFVVNMDEKGILIMLQRCVYI